MPRRRATTTGLRAALLSVVVATTLLFTPPAIASPGRPSGGAETRTGTVTAIGTGGAISTPVQPRRPAGPATRTAYLTFDDGPTAPYTLQVLRVLERYRAKATFFMIGRQAAARPDLVREVRAGGHAIGNHTWDHPNLTRASASTIADQLTSTNKALGGRIGCLRPPGGATGPEVQRIAGDQGMRVVLWNVDTRDWTRPGVPALVSAASGPPAGGGAPVILLHDGGGDRSQTVAALPRILETLARRGYRFETLPACR